MVAASAPIAPIIPILETTSRDYLKPQKRRTVPINTTGRSDEREAGYERFYLVTSGMGHANLNALYGPLESHKKFYNFIKGSLIVLSGFVGFAVGDSDVQSAVNKATSDCFRDRVCWVV
jgi:hypothetical protein